MRRSLAVTILVLALVPFLAGCGGGGVGGTKGAVVVALVANLDSPDHEGLYGYDAQGHLVRRLSGPLAAGWGVGDVAWSPDRTRIAFVDDKVAADREQVFVVDPESDADPVPVTALPPMPGTVHVSDLRWSPDGASLLLDADLEADGSYSLYVVPAAGGAVVSLSDASKKVYYSTWFWSPDGQYVTWMESDTVNGPLRQMVAPSDGSSPVNVSGAMVAGGGVRVFQGVSPWAPNSARLAFVADKEVDERLDVYTVGPAGSGLVKLSTTLGPNDDVYDYAWAPDSSRLAFRQGVGGVTSTLVTVPAAGGVVAPVSAGGEYPESVAWQPGTMRIAWGSYDSGLQRDVLRTALVGVAGTVTLWTGSTSKESLGHDWRWSPDGTRIAFRAGDPNPADDHMRLYAVALAAPGAIVDLIPTVGSTGNVDDDDFAWNADSVRVVARAVEDDVVPGQVFLARADGSGTEQVSAVSADQGGPSEAAFTSDGLTTVWIEGYSAPTEALWIGDADGHGAHRAAGPGPELNWALPR